jgi:hypothetical protein
MGNRDALCIYHAKLVSQLAQFEGTVLAFWRSDSVVYSDGSVYFNLIQTQCELWCVLRPHVAMLMGVSSS